MPSLHAAQVSIVRCCKWLERAGERLTGAIGPFFVGLAVLLMTTGCLSFFIIIGPTLSMPLISLPLCALVATNMLAHYYFVCTVPPGTPDDGLGLGEGQGLLWASKRQNNGALSSEYVVADGERRFCVKCERIKPERAHHCRICKTCVLKYDHHCPWINQCVGIRNERHFILFMFYLVLASGSFVALGFQHIFIAFDYSDWPSEYIPRLVFIVIYVLSAALGFAVGIMLAWQLHLISSAETTVEHSDFENYRRNAKHRQETFVNSYDLGRKKNISLFFNLRNYPLYTLLLPLRCAPYTDGFTWARRDGYQRHQGVRPGDEMTDEDD